MCVDEFDPRGTSRAVGSAPPPTGHVIWPCVEAAAHAYRQGAHHADARDAPIAAASLAHVSTDLSGWPLGDRQGANSHFGSSSETEGPLGMLRGNANMWHKSALLPQRVTRCSRAAGSWHHPIRVECTRCSATGAALMRAVLACSRCAPKARHRQGHKPGPQRDCGPGVVASSMACDHGERTYGDRLRSPTPTWLTGPTKQLSRSARRYT